MYRVIKVDGTELGMTDSVNYIKIHENGCFTPAKREEAVGIAFKNVPYNLLGHEDIVGADTVVVSEVDSGSHITNHQLSIEGLIKIALEG